MPGAVQDRIPRQTELIAYRAELLTHPVPCHLAPTIVCGERPGAGLLAHLPAFPQDVSGTRGQRHIADGILRFALGDVHPAALRSLFWFEAHSVPSQITAFGDPETSVDQEGKQTLHAGAALCDELGKHILGDDELTLTLSG